jgi:hypothetical protein
MLRKAIIFSAMLFCLAVAAGSASAQEWVNLGSKEVKDRSEQDTWHVGAGKGEFRRIKLTVQQRAVRFYRLEVKFENGEKQNIELRNVIRAGGETRLIDLVGKDRRIDKVDVWYEAQTVRRGVRSQVTLYGIK